MGKKAVKEKRDVEKYFRLARKYLRDAKRYLRQGNLRQASEKYWEAMAEAIKGWSEFLGMRHHSHRLIHQNARKIFHHLNRKDLMTALSEAAYLHVNFYEDWLDEDGVKEIGKDVEDAVKILLWEYENRKV